MLKEYLLYYWRYDTQTEVWNTGLSPLDARTGQIGDVGSLCFYNGNVYAFIGADKRFFARYNVAGNTWSFMRNFIENAGAGAALTVARSAGGTMSSTVDAFVLGGSLVRETPSLYDVRVYYE